jgi:hypothetical protein
MAEYLERHGNTACLAPGCPPLTIVPAILDSSYILLVVNGLNSVLTTLDASLSFAEILIFRSSMCVLLNDSLFFLVFSFCIFGSLNCKQYPFLNFYLFCF